MAWLGELGVRRRSSVHTYCRERGHSARRVSLYLYTAGITGIRGSICSYSYVRARAIFAIVLFVICPDSCHEFSAAVSQQCTLLLL